MLAGAATAASTFEVASVRVVPGSGPSGGCKGGPGSSDPERVTCSNVFLAEIVATAWQLPFYRFVVPDWMKTGHFDITAKIPPGATREQYREMLQNLLTERFHLVAHHESRLLPAYSLTAAKGGPRIAISPANQTAQMAIAALGGHWQLTARKQSMKSFAGWLSVRLQSAVTDETGVTGDYDFALDFSPDGIARDDSLTEQQREQLLGGNHSSAGPTRIAGDGEKGSGRRPGGGSCRQDSDRELMIFYRPEATGCARSTYARSRQTPGQSLHTKDSSSTMNSRGPS